MKCTVFTLLAASCLLATCLALTNDEKRNIRLGVTGYFENGKKNKAFKDAVESLKVPKMFRSTYKPMLDRDIYCSLCDSLVDGIVSDRRNGSTVQEIADYVVGMCVNLNIESEEVCRGAVDLNLEILVYIVDNKPELTSTHICSVILQAYGCESDMPVNWSIDIPEKDTHVPEDDLSGHTIRIAHVTDIHYDILYKPGGLANCDKPLCCQEDVEHGHTEEDKAGYWGDYRTCDTPWHAVEDVLQRINIDHSDIDAVYFTGDIIHHKVWATSEGANKADMYRTLNAFKQHFRVPVFPILGNHEPHPLNVWVDSLEPHITSQWVFDLAAEEWHHWLGEDGVKTVKQGGYYSVHLKHGLRVIGLNSNVCYTFNWWLLYDEVDPYGQLKWLVEELLKAEQARERVHILSHIPSGSSSCLKNWAREFRRIVERFSGTIKAIFNGHTHNDEFVVFHKKEDINEAVAVAFNGGSVTTYEHLNPNYKILDVDAETFEVLEIETFIFNLTEANIHHHKSPTWFSEYKFKEFYDLDRLRPSDVSNLVTKMASEKWKLDNYYEFYVKQADTALSVPCEEGCQLENLCRMVANEHGDTEKCDQLTALFSPQKH